MVNSPPRSLRLCFIALAGLSLLVGIWIGIVRLGFPLPLPSAALISLHGPLMTMGFLLTLIGLERAAALDRWWIYGVPLLSSLSVIALIGAAAPFVAPAFATGAAIVLTAFFIALYRRQPEEHFIVMTLSAVILACGNLLWLSAAPVHRAVPWWAGFLVMMIAGERLELARLRSPRPLVRALFRLAAALFVAGLAWSLGDFRFGVRLAGAGLIATALWLLRYDLAWQNLKQPGLPRFMACGLIAGYFWLAIAGIFWIWFARFFGAGPLYDVALHTVFLGFVFSMIFAHGPIILPSITGLALRFNKTFYLHLGLLHVSLLLRVAGDLALLPGGQKWGGLLNVLAIFLFIFNSLRAVLGKR